MYTIGYNLLKSKGQSYREWSFPISYGGVPGDELTIYVLSLIAKIHTTVYFDGDMWSILKDVQTPEVMEGLSQLHLCYLGQSCFLETGKRVQKLDPPPSLTLPCDLLVHLRQVKKSPKPKPKINKPKQVPDVQEANRKAEPPDNKSSGRPPLITPTPKKKGSKRDTHKGDSDSKIGYDWWDSETDKNKNINVPKVSKRKNKQTGKSADSDQMGQSPRIIYNTRQRAKDVLQLDEEPTQFDYGSSTDDFNMLASFLGLSPNVDFEQQKRVIPQYVTRSVWKDISKPKKYLQNRLH